MPLKFHLSINFLIVWFKRVVCEVENQNLTVLSFSGNKIKRVIGSSCFQNIRWMVNLSFKFYAIDSGLQIASLLITYSVGMFTVICTFRIRKSYLGDVKLILFLIIRRGSQNDLLSYIILHDLDIREELTSQTPPL